MADPVLSAFSAPDPACFVTVTRDNRIKVWDAVRGRPRRPAVGGPLPTCTPGVEGF